MDNLLDKKVALVTGSTSGIGRASAIALAKEGAKVIVSGRREEEGKKTVDMIKKAGGEAFFIRADVTKESDVKALVQNTIKKYGRLDIAFNNAGVLEAGPLVKMNENNYKRMFDTNVKGVFLCMKYEIQVLKNGGSIINTASIAGVVGSENLALYDATKHAVIGLTKSAALEVAKKNIRINAVCPGAIDTALLNNFITKAEIKEIGASHPLGRIGRPEEIADMVVFLASSKASFITGSAMLVDGGFTAQ